MSRPEAIAIVHYHLRPGGVTRVIEHAVAALEPEGVRIAVLYGAGTPAPGPPLDRCARPVEGLAYDGADGPVSSPAALAQSLEEAARRALGRAPDLWHVHNHSLGKNCALPAALRRLAERGHRLLLQPHDFPEDGRPENYDRLRRRLRDGEDDETAALNRNLYPTAEHVHYATVNSRDRHHLTEAGLPAERVHPLPNAVELPETEDEEPAAIRSEGRLFLYPTRAIRRKNLGELLLWSALGGEGDRFATTLAPKNPEQHERYERWVEYARRRGLPVDFEVGERSDVSFTAMLRSAHALVTTSVAEGFGLAFLEPWLAGRPLVGRNLPQITEDFATEGVDLSPLYTRLDVPLAWVSEDELRGRIREALRNTCRAYNRPCGEEDVERAMHGAVEAGYVDFGRLDEPLQRVVIDRVCDDAGVGREIHPPRLESPGFDDPQRVARNAALIRERFSRDNYGRRLGQVYGHLLGAEMTAVDGLEARSVLQRFLDPEGFCLLRA